MCVLTKMAGFGIFMSKQGVWCPSLCKGNLTNLVREQLTGERGSMGPPFSTQ